MGEDMKREIEQLVEKNRRLLQEAEQDRRRRREEGPEGAGIAPPRAGDHPQGGRCRRLNRTATLGLAEYVAPDVCGDG